MKLLDYWNRQAEKFTILDVKLAQCAAMAFVQILAKLFPEITSVGVGWLIALAIVCASRPAYVMYLKRQ